MKTILARNLLTLTLASSTAYAGSVAGFGGSLEVTQFAQMAQDATNAFDQLTRLNNMLSNLKNQYRNLQANTRGLSNFEWGNARSHLVELSNVIRQGQALAYSLNSIDEEYRSRFKNYDQYVSSEGQSPDYYAEKYNAWSSTNLDTIRSTMKASNLQYEHFSSEEETIRSLELMGQSATGRMQALQVGHQLASAQVRQMQKLRQLVLSQNQMQAAFMATSTDKEAFHKAQAVKYYKATEKPTVGNGGRY